MGGSTLDPYLGCNFLILFYGPLHLQLQSHLCLTWDHLGVNFRSWCSSRCIFGLQLFGLNLGSTLVFQLQSHLCLTLDHGGGQFQIWIQLQIHICVVPFEGPLHLQLQSHLYLTLDHVGGGSTPEKCGVNSTFFLYRSISAAHDWIGSSPSDCQWAKKENISATCTFPVFSAKWCYTSHHVIVVIAIGDVHKS